MKLTTLEYVQLEKDLIDAVSAISRALIQMESLEISRMKIWETQQLGQKINNLRFDLLKKIVEE